MPTCVKWTLKQFQHSSPAKKQDAPYMHIPPKYGATMQYAEYDTSAPVGKEEQKHVQTELVNFYDMRGQSMEWY